MFSSTVIECPYCGHITPYARKKCVHCGLNIKANLSPKLCCYTWYRFLHRKELEALRENVGKEYLKATIGGNPVEHSLWYQAMQMYIEKYTEKVISRRICHKYGRKDVDDAVKEGIVEKRKDGYCQAFWIVKKAIIEQKYGLIWHTPQEMDPNIRFD